jgi:glyceraldehyde 3-phosphate dehydrogenase
MTNCVVPMVKVLHLFGVRRGAMTTVHAYTNDQSIRTRPLGTCGGRAAAINIVLTSTGAGAQSAACPSRRQVRSHGPAGPVADGSITDLWCRFG